MTTIDKISFLLGKNNKNQKDLTDYLGIEKSVFTTWKNGKSKSYRKYISEIARFLNTSVEYLLNDNGSNSEVLSDVYFSLAKSAQEEGIDPDDIKLAIETIKAMRKKTGDE